jgi:hypothetical protein
MLARLVGWQERVTILNKPPDRLDQFPECVLIHRLPGRFFFRPCRDCVRIEIQQHVQMIVHNREPTDRDREDARQLIKSGFDPCSAIKRVFG